MISFIFSRTEASSFADSVDRKICSSKGLRAFWLGGERSVALLALRGEFRLKASDCVATLGLALGDLGLSNVSAPIVGLALALDCPGPVRPLHVFRADGGSFGVSLGEVWTGLAVCFGLGVFPLLGVLFLTGECGILVACRRTVFGDSCRKLLLGELLLSSTMMRSGLPRLDLSSMELDLRFP